MTTPTKKEADSKSIEEPIHEISTDEAEKVAGGDGAVPSPPVPAPDLRVESYITRS